MDTRLKGSVLALAVAGVLGLAACGGSGGTSGSTGTTVGTTTSGVITGFGSVYVNGVEYETTGATVSVDGASGTEDDLEVGMVVTLEGSVNSDGATGQAAHISFADELEGVILSNDIATAGTLNIMGQTVHVTADTVFANGIGDPAIAGLVDLAPQQVVEVSGYASGTGEIYATRIELKKAVYATGDEIEVKGVITNITATTFSLGDLIVDYSGTGFVPVEGLYVEAKSNALPSADTTGTYTLVATAVEIEDDGEHGHDGAEGEEIELQGVVTDNSGLPDSFMLNGDKVLLGEIEGSFDAATLAVGQTVRVEAHFNADGALVAEEFEFGVESELEFEGAVEAVDVSASTVTVFGQTIRITPTTRMMDEQDENVVPLKYFSLADLNDSEYVEIAAYRDDTGALVANSLTRDDAGGAVQLKGYVESVTGLMAVVEGVSVDCSGLATVPAQGDKVEVHGTWDGSVITATELSFQ